MAHLMIVSAIVDIIYSARRESIAVSPIPPIVPLVETGEPSISTQKAEPLWIDKRPSSAPSHCDRHLSCFPKLHVFLLFC